MEEETICGRSHVKSEPEHYSDRTIATDSDRSLSPNETMASSNNRNNSFCIDALLAKDSGNNRICNSPSTASRSPNSSRSASISPGSEIQSSFSEENIQLPNSISGGGGSAGSNFLSMSSAAAILANHQHGNGQETNSSNGNFYGLYPVGSSAFQPLPRMDMNSRSVNIPGAVTKMLAGGPVGHSGMTAGHLQQMQLEWFARAGMFYAGPRLQESPGIFGIGNFFFFFLFHSRLVRL